MTLSLSRRLLALGLALSLPVAAYAQAPKHAKHDAAAKPAAAPAPAKEAKAKPVLTGEYAIMASELNFTDDQKTQLAAKIHDRETQTKAWEAEHGAKLTEVEAAVKAAKEAKDKDKLAAAVKEHDSLTAGKAQIKTNFDASVKALLTPEQTKNWEGFNLYRSTLMGLSKAKLTDAQKAEVRSRAMKAAADTTGKSNAKTLKESIVSEVLTAEQRTELTAPMAKKAAPAAPAGSQPAAAPKPM
ncbi:MAG: hypothetical protein NTW19_24230 [Planctomycetota bacterium]|nr:hypothetical protein [Planctomycetota bacterium]